MSRNGKSGKAGGRYLCLWRGGGIEVGFRAIEAVENRVMEWQGVYVEQEG